MKFKFYDVKVRAFVNTDVLAKVKYENGRCAFRGETADGRNLTCFVSQDKFDAAKDVKAVKAPAKKACKCCKK